MYTQVKGEYPPPHQRYIVRRAYRYFVATPYYTGLGDTMERFWVVSTFNRELEAIPMEPNDRWRWLEQET